MFIANFDQVTNKHKYCYGNLIDVNIGFSTRIFHLHCVNCQHTSKAYHVSPSLWCITRSIIYGIRLVYPSFSDNFPFSSKLPLFIFANQFFLIHFQMALHYDGSVKYYAWRFNSDLSSLRNGNIYFKAFASIFNKSIEHGIFQKKAHEFRIPHIVVAPTEIL